MKSFGELLRYYRRESTDPQRGGSLTQERLGELLGNEIGIREGMTGATISHWERGKHRIGSDDMLTLIALIKVLHDCNGIKTLAQAKSLLQSVNCRDLTPEEIQQISKDWAVGNLDGEGQNSQKSRASTSLRQRPIELLDGETGTLWPPNIPDDPYFPLPGRERQMEVLLDLFHADQDSAIIVIDGLGGLGKTAFGVELARRILKVGEFEGILGDSAKQEMLVGGEVVQIREATLDFNSLLDTIAGQLKNWDIIPLSQEEKFYALIHFFRNHHYLILVDNLETSENANLLVTRLKSFLNGTKIVVTSRKRVRHDFVKNITLEELEDEDALFFIQNEAQTHKPQQILNASDEQMRQIVNICGGAPLALKLVVAQVNHIDIDVVLSTLSKAESNLYPFIYKSSWDQLSLTAQKILIYIGKTVVTTVSWEELEGINIAKDQADLVGAVDQLVSFSLLNTFHIHNKPRYGIHQLTRRFVNSDLPDIWRSEGLLKS
jgi:hypothetical protein